MKSSKPIRVQTTLGELVSAIWEETEALFKFKRNEKQLVVAYVLNDLLTRPDYESHGIATKKDSGKDPAIVEGNRAVNPPVLETLSLTRRFGERIAVDSLTVSVKRGEVFGLLGPNGAGKTTILKMLTTLLPPSSGSARIAGFDIVRQSADVRRVIGYVPQLLSADGALTGYENVCIFAKLYDIPQRRSRSAHQECAGLHGIRRCSSAGRAHLFRAE